MAMILYISYYHGMIPNNKSIFSMDGVTTEIFDWEGSFEKKNSNFTCKITTHLFYSTRLVDT
jgi:hypothetical protein